MAGGSLLLRWQLEEQNEIYTWYYHLYQGIWSQADINKHKFSLRHFVITPKIVKFLTIKQITCISIKLLERMMVVLVA